MVKFKYEEVILSLSSKYTHSHRELHEFLLNRDFKIMDDLYFKPRYESFPKWQIDEFISIQLFFEGKAAFSTTEDVIEKDDAWDRLDLSYLLASLPRRYIDMFISEAVALSDKFDLRFRMDGEDISFSTVSNKMNSLADQLEGELGEAGSEIVNYLIELEYL